MKIEVKKGSLKILAVKHILGSVWSAPKSKFVAIQTVTTQQTFKQT